MSLSSNLIQRFQAAEAMKGHPASIGLYEFVRADVDAYVSGNAAG